MLRANSYQQTTLRPGNKPQLPPMRRQSLIFRLPPLVNIKLYVDRALTRARRPPTANSKNAEDLVFVPRNGIFGGRNSLTFFSDGRLLSLSTRLRNNKVNELVGRISTIVNGRLRRADSTANTRRMPQPDSITDMYFERVHPVFPFLDKALFEATVNGPNFLTLLERSKPWSCLYHTILALGSQYADGGTFEAGKGESWRLFSVALGGFSDLLLLPDSLTILQALTAMSVYGLGICGLAVEPVIMSEAARRAQIMSTNNFTGTAAVAYQKAFWILYTIEKITSFHFGRSSSFVDSDIFCPIPLVPEATVEDGSVLARKNSNMKAILGASRSILELTTMIEVEPYTVTWVIAGIPITALFVLFDIVVHDPRQPEVASNLALLDMAAGHFSRIEYASGGTLPGSLIAEFAKIARDYVNEIQHGDIRISGLARSSTATQDLGTSLPRPPSSRNNMKPMEMTLDLSNTMPGDAFATTAMTMPSSFADFSFDNGLDQVSPGALMGTDGPHVLACVFCHQRKIKCDRKSPCANCIKADQPCIPSTRAPAGAGRRRVVKDLLERLNQCESLLSQVAPRDAEGRPFTSETPPAFRDVMTTASAAAADSPSMMSYVSYEEARKQPDQRPTGKIVVDEGRPNTTEDGSLDSRESMDFDILALGAVEMLRLWQVFLERVNPMTKVIHVPSLEPLVFEAATDHGNVAPDFEALLCSINVLAIMALSEAESEQILNVPKNAALRKASLALKKAVSKVDFLRKYNLTILQCLVLYLVSLQGQFDRHASWILTGMLVRIAQRMGLHRDGELIGLTPFETEMRRRIWWQIIMLETKYAVLAGFCDTLLPPNWDTKLPSNLNDADLLPGSLEPLRSREGATEMAFCLMLYESRHFFCENPVPEFESVVLGQGDLNADRSKAIEGPQSLDKYRVIVDQLEERLIVAEKRYCNPTIGGIHVLACKLRPLVAQRMRDMIAHAREPWKEDADSLAGQQSLFRLWVIHFESDLNWYDTIDDRFRWYPKLHLQADAFSVMIELLQWQPVGTLVDRAWKAIDRVFFYHPELYDLSKRENVQRAENLLAGWQRRELAFRNVGQSIETPVVIERLRGSGNFPASKAESFPEPFSTATADSTLFPGLHNSGFDGFDGNVLLNTDAASFFWDGAGEHHAH
ncbi:Aurofusarin cluster transcription factor aurR2 [Colletotrichum gloeosporioides]|uniref:Aurofusarin cluster transcription factor aurR2 n=1 Tax=Colletotrichum gloeosporioides TaxID=474922 RepID=A0A8H4CW07_COLGL|nr:Aurofusarin cluster transcription factor aurR2 [Colletotrichum gloeosporioides]KAF3810886.1 Aurofusarin cluster transcription factor aurR2 [Colletotrichum gloeosporioides]